MSWNARNKATLLRTSPLYWILFWHMPWWRKRRPNVYWSRKLVIHLFREKENQKNTFSSNLFAKAFSKFHQLLGWPPILDLVKKILTYPISFMHIDFVRGNYIKITCLSLTRHFCELILHPILLFFATYHTCSTNSWPPNQSL